MSIVNAIAFDEIRIQRNPGGDYVTVDAEEIIKNFDAKLTPWSKEPPTAVERDLNIVKNSTDTAVNRLVVWLTERALKEDSR